MEGPPGQATILGYACMYALCCKDCLLHCVIQLISRRVVANLQHSLSEKQLNQSNLVTVDPHDLATLRRILAEDIPALRRRAGLPQPHQPPHLPYMENYNAPSTPPNVESSPSSFARRESSEAYLEAELLSPGNELLEQLQSSPAIESEENVGRVAQGDSS